MRFYLFVQRAPLYNPLSPLYTHRRARSSWSGYIATRYVASSSYILIRSPRSLNLCTLSPTVSFLFFVLESRATLSFLPSRHEIQPWVLGTYITLTELPLPPLSLSFLSTDRWFLCMKLCFDPSSLCEEYAERSFHDCWSYFMPSFLTY